MTGPSQQRGGAARPGAAAERVFITGMGAITPAGLSADALWASVSAGQSAISVLEGEEFAGLPVRIGGQVRGFAAEDHVPRPLARRLEPMHVWAIAAADEALAAVCGGLTVPAELPWDPHRVMVIAATGSGPVTPQQRAAVELREHGPRAVPLSLAMHGAPDAPAALISQRHGLRGPAHAVSATCASGAVGLGEALRALRHGYADAAVVVGVEDCLNPMNLASNANMRALAAGFEDRPEAASRPFDAHRAGFVMSAGAAALVLESESAVRARGGVALAELAGFGATSDAHHPTAPHPEGRGAVSAVRQALADAGLTPAEFAHGAGGGEGAAQSGMAHACEQQRTADASDQHIPRATASDSAAPASTAPASAWAENVRGHINAHGTSTPAGDAAEAAALTAVFGEHLPALAVTAPKSSIGHLLGAGGVAEAILSVRALQERTVPPTLNLEEPDFPGLRIVGAAGGTGAAGGVGSAGAAAGAHSIVCPRMEWALSNSFGFGGHNAALIIRRTDHCDASEGKRT